VPRIGSRFFTALVGLSVLLSICIAQTNSRASPQNQLLISKQQFTLRLVAAAVERANHVVRYVPDYVRIDYPNGDVPASTGVCADEIIRAYREVGVDLQKEVHEDMAAHFAEYPRQWSMTHTDTNIDHRRVPNLMVFFARKGEALPVTKNTKDYLPGDIVTWDLGGNVPHVGIVVDRHPLGSSSNLVLHNVGEGPKIEDVLFRWQITGHYRYYGPRPDR
jgi:uncharacterized protein YijF (DUF1287 family)